MLLKKENIGSGMKRFIPISILTFSLFLLVIFLKTNEKTHDIFKLTFETSLLVSMNIAAIIYAIYLLKKYGRETFTWVALLLGIVTTFFEVFGLLMVKVLFS